MPPIQGFFMCWGLKTLKLISMESSLSFFAWPLNHSHHWVGFRVYTWVNGPLKSKSAHCWSTNMPWPLALGLH